MAIYNASLLISASNATYFTNVTGGIAAVAVRDFNDTWISSSALLTGSNTFVGNQIISGNVDINGTITASLQTGYLYVGNGSGKTQAVATSSIIANTDTGSLLVTGSVSGNTLTFTKGDASTFNLSVATGSTANIDTGSFATTGSNVFKGTQFLYSTDGAAPLQISSSAYYGIQLQNQGIQITGNGGPRIQFPNHAWLNGNENDNFQFTADTDDPVTRGIDFFLYGSGSRSMKFRNNSGPGGNIDFSTSQSVIQFYAGDNIGITAGNQLSLTGSQTNINGLRYPQTDGTNGQALITNGSGILSFGNVSIDTGSFATTGSNTFTGNQTISTAGNTQLNLVAQPGFQTNIDFQSENSNFRAYGDFRINNNGDAGGTGSIKMLTKNNFIEFAADEGLRFGVVNAGGNGIEGGFVTINVPSGSQQLQLTGSLNVSNTLTASLQQGYVWVGNSSNVSTLVATSSFGSGGTIDTGSFLTTGSLAFGGSTNKGNGIYQFNIATGSAGYAIEIFNTGSDALYGGTGSMRFGITDPGNPFIQLKGQPWFQFGTGNQLQFQSFTSSYDNGIIIGPYYTSSEKVHLMPRSSSLQFSQDIGSGEVPIFTLGTHNGVSQSIFEKDLRVKGQFTASLANGFTYVGNASGISTLVATSSFGSSISTGSLLVTASFDNTTRDITFTKGDATTFKLGGFATTGSNTFYGNQTISGSSGGGNFNINAAGASNGTVSINQTGAGNLQFLQSGSIIIRTTAIGSIDHNWTSSFYNDINVANNSRIILTGNATPSSGNGEVYLLSRSGSLVLSNSTQTATAAGVSNITSSQINGNTSLMFKTIGNSTGSLLLQGASNIFTVPTSPANLTYQKYIGGSNNLYLQNQGGVQTLLTSSAASVSGNRPTMHNNIIYGQSDFTINLPNNPGSNNYNQNLINGTTTINAMGFTGSLTLSNNINNSGAITINAASASFVEIASGLSGSHTINVQGNGIFGGIITQNTNRNQSNVGQNITSNVIAGGQISITNHSSSVQVNASNNITNGVISYSNAGAANLALHRSVATINTNYGPLTLIASASAISANNNICSSALTVTNRMYSGSLGSGSISFNNNSVQGAGNSYVVSGSYNGTAAGTLFAQNCIFGGSNTFFTNVEGRGNYTSFNSNGIFGANLILTGSNNNQLSEQGGGHFGRWNANDGIRNTTGENIFSVGTGVSGSRKTGFLIDSGSNSFFEGSLNVSGSTSMTGSLLVTSFTTLASVSSSLDFADDTAAAAGGVPLGGLYRNGNFVMIRLT